MGLPLTLTSPSSHTTLISPSSHALSNARMMSLRLNGPASFLISSCQDLVTLTPSVTIFNSFLHLLEVIIPRSLRLSNWFDTSNKREYNILKSKRRLSPASISRLFYNGLRSVLYVPLIAGYVTRLRLECQKYQTEVVIVATSKLQRQIKNRLRSLLTGCKMKENYRPDWLENPDTGRNLELDFWLPELKAAIEVQGRQHKEFVPFFHGTPEAFGNQIERDRYKKMVCDNHGVYLHEVYAFQDIDIFLDMVFDNNPSAVSVVQSKNTAAKMLSYYAARLIQNSKNADKNWVAKISRKMTSLSVEYRIPLKDVEPDFEIKKMEIYNPGKPIVRIKCVSWDGMTKMNTNAAIVKASGDDVLLRWKYKYEDAVCGFVERWFSLLDRKITLVSGDTWIIKSDAPNKDDWPNIWKKQDEVVL